MRILPLQGSPLAHLLRCEESCATIAPRSCWVPQSTTFSIQLSGTLHNHLSGVDGPYFGSGSGNKTSTTTPVTILNHQAGDDENA